MSELLDELLLVSELLLLGAVADVSELVEPVVPVELVEPVAPVELGSELVELVLDGLVVLVLMLPLVLPVAEVSVEVLVSELLRVASRLQPAKPKATAASADAARSLIWLVFICIGLPKDHFGGWSRPDAGERSSR